MSPKNFRFLVTLAASFLVLTSPFFFGKSSSPTDKTNTPKEKIEGEQIKAELETTLLLTGDVMLGRTVTTKSLEENDPIYPFRKIADRLRAADLVFVNLENPIIRECPIHESGFIFCAPPQMLEGLIFSGVDIVNVANNHSRNYGEEGLFETLNFLSERGILATGLRELMVIERNQTAFGFLGFDYTVNGPSLEDYELIKNSDSSVDVLVVGVHWGIEYTAEPQEYQREWARQKVALGADVIAGHHPHWAQIHEMINGKPVYYSLGNFVFDQMWSEETRKGMAVELTFKGESLQGVELLPVFMQNWAQPEFVSGEGFEPS